MVDAILSLKVVGRILSVAQPICLTSLTPHRSTYKLGGVDGGWASGSARRAGRENCGGNIK